MKAFKLKVSGSDRKQARTPNAWTKPDVTAMLVLCVIVANCASLSMSLLHCGSAQAGFVSAM
jgi:hypothetical protein